MISLISTTRLNIDQLKVSPIAASQKDHEGKVYWNFYGNLLPLKQAKFKVGDKIRITKKKGIFEKDGPKKSLRCPTC